MPRVTNYRVQCDVIAYTPTTIYHDDLMADLFTISTTKTTANVAGTFTLTLADRQDADGRSWADKLPFRTYVEIRAGIADGVPPILMRGLVDSPGQSLQLPTNLAGGPERAITITGRDLGAIWADWQVLYLWGIDPMATYLAATTGGDALAQSLGITTGTQDVTMLATGIVDRLANGAVEGLNRLGLPVPRFTPVVHVPPQYTVNFLSLQPWQGPYANLMGYFASPPWGEWFVFDAPDGPQVILRQTPYKRFTDGSYPLPFGQAASSAGFFADVTADAGDITARTLALNATQGENYTYYVTQPDLASASGSSYAQWFTSATGSQPSGQAQIETLPSNPFYDAAQAPRFGVQPLQLTTPWISTLGQALQQQAAAAMTAWLVEVFRHNDELASGTITVHGDPAWTIGRYGVWHLWHWEAYIEQVNHTISLSATDATWTTQLGVVRGRVRGAGE